MRAKEYVKIAAKNTATCKTLRITRSRGHRLLHDNTICLLLLLNGGWCTWIHSVPDPSLS